MGRTQPGRPESKARHTVRVLPGTPVLAEADGSVEDSASAGVEVLAAVEAGVEVLAGAGFTRPGDTRRRAFNKNREIIERRCFSCQD